MSVQRLWLSGVGYVLGMLIVLLSLNVYLQFQELLSKKEAANFLTVSKKVKNISFKGDAFTPPEIEELKQQPFVERLTPINVNKFGVWMDLEMLNLHTQALAEAIPDEFIDVELPLSWRKYKRSWDPESDYVPIIVSKEMINMYNLSFALSNGTPQVTDNLIKTLSGRIRIKGNGKVKRFNTSIVGLTERVNTILVPQTFLSWANNEFADTLNSSFHKILVEVDNRTDPKIETFFIERAYEVEKSQLINQKNLSTLYRLLIVMVVFGVAFMVFSMTIIVTNFALLIAESKNEIKLLKTLGYPVKVITNHFFKYILKLEVLTTVLTFGLLYPCFFFIALYFQGKGFDIGRDIKIQVLVLGVMLLVITLFISRQSLKKITKK